MKYMLIAGEVSGDIHGAELIKALRRADPGAQFAIVGGDSMARAAGVEPLLHISRMAFMGFAAVLRNIFTIRRNFTTVYRALEAEKPDAVILIDYPSFNLRIARRAHKSGIPTYYYIPPKVWAWKSWRVRNIRRYTRRVYAIFPFEPEFYTRHNARAVYAGNPSVVEVAQQLAQVPTRQELYSALHIPTRRPIVALLPGSRQAEIRANLPVMMAAMENFPQYRPVIAAAPGIPDELYARYAPGVSVWREYPAVALLAHATTALVTSGTATLETALCRIPQVALYRANGSAISHGIMKRLLKVNFVTLPNLILGRGAIPELLLHHCTTAEVTTALTPLLKENNPERDAQLESYAELAGKLGTGDPAEYAAADIAGELTRAH